MTYRVRVSGRVQGVGFRYSTRKEGARRRVGGYVRNHPDGTVEVVCQGDKEQLDQFIKWLKKGPPSARVESTTVEEVHTKKSFPRFSIEY